MLGLISFFLWCENGQHRPSLLQHEREPTNLEKVELRFRRPAHQIENVGNQLGNSPPSWKIDMAGPSQRLVGDVKVLDEEQDECIDAVGELRVGPGGGAVLGEIGGFGPSPKSATERPMSGIGIVDGDVRLPEELIRPDGLVLPIDHGPQPDVFGVSTQVAGDEPGELLDAGRLEHTIHLRGGVVLFGVDIPGG